MESYYFDRSRERRGPGARLTGGVSPNRVLPGVLLLLALLLPFGQLHAAPIDLASLIQQGGATITLSPTKTYVLNAEYYLTRSLTILGNGATITGQGPLRAHGNGITLIVDNCIIQSTGWGALAASNGSNLIVRNSTISCPGGTGIFAIGSMLTVEADTSITSCSVGINLYDASTAIVDNCIIQSTGWGALAASNGSNLIVRNSTISCPGGTGIFAIGSMLTVEADTSITSCWIGINLYDASTANLHGISVTGCQFAVQATGTTTSVTVDQNSSLSYSDQGIGVGVIGGASAIVRDSTLTGFTNAIDIQPSNPAGTATVVNCLFVNNGCSALIAVSAQNVLFSGCRVQDAQQDGVYFHGSTGVVENSEVIGSLNTGVTFMGCSNGATIRNCLVKNSVHQGLAIVADGGVPSLNVQVLSNTFSNNTITNLLIDAESTAQLQGNIFSGAPDASVRLHGPQGITLDSALVTDSHYGIEIKDGSSPRLVLSSITENDTTGILVYGNSFLTSEHSCFWLNDLSAMEGTSSVFVNEGAAVKARYCSFGPAENPAFFNNSVVTCDVVSNFWDAADGPYTPWVSGGGCGAELAWNIYNGAAVQYCPFLTQVPVETKVDSNLSLTSGASLVWDSGLDVSLVLNSRTGSENLVEETVGVLRVFDTAHLNMVHPPANLLSGQLYVVWISTPLRSNSLSASLKFSMPFREGPVFLQRREIDGTWTSVSGVWDQVTQVLTYSPGDVHLLNGTFALTGEGNSSRALGPDFNLNLRTDFTLWRPTVQRWFGKDPLTGARFDMLWGSDGDIPFVGDFDGDSQTDIGVWRPSTGIWYVLLSSTDYSCASALRMVWGKNGDIPVPGDYDGDGVTDLGIWRPAIGIWYVKDRYGNVIARTPWGQNGDIPVPGDYDGDGVTDFGQWRPSNGTWYIKNASGTTIAQTQWGMNGDVPVPADFNGDRATDLGTWRPSTGIWEIADAFGSEIAQLQLGANGDIPLAGDYDGDRIADVAVFQPATAQWAILTAGSQFFDQLTGNWGANGDLPFGCSPFSALRQYLSQHGYYP